MKPIGAVETFEVSIFGIYFSSSIWSGSKCYIPSCGGLAFSAKLINDYELEDESDDMLSVEIRFGKFYAELDVNVEK